jgi:Spy/CpxP family protein refolding chaperone
MKKLIAILAIFSLGALTVEAQRGPRGPQMSPKKRAEMANPEKRAEMMTNRMAEKLELSAAQKEEVYAIHLENASKRQAEMEARKAQMQTNQKGQQAKIEAVLTPEQKEKFIELRDENKDKMNTIRDARTNPDGQKIQQRRRGNRGPGGQK